MDRLISEKAVIDAITEWLFDRHTIKSAEDVIKAIPSAEPKCESCELNRQRFQKSLDVAFELGKSSADKWIPVSERLPEGKINPITQDFEPILCTVEFGGLKTYRDVRIYKFGKPTGCHEPHFWDCSQNVDDRVLAWMPLPKPWEGEHDETDN